MSKKQTFLYKRLSYETFWGTQIHELNRKLLRLTGNEEQNKTGASQRPQTKIVEGMDNIMKAKLAGIYTRY
jgi:hypothetical protein